MTNANRGLKPDYTSYIPSLPQTPFRSRDTVIHPSILATMVNCGLLTYEYFFTPEDGGYVVYSIAKKA